MNVTNAPLCGKMGNKASLSIFMQQLAGTGGSRMDFKVTTNDRGGWQAVWGQLQQQFPFQSD